MRLHSFCAIIFFLTIAAFSQHLAADCLVMNRQTILGPPQSQDFGFALAMTETYAFFGVPTNGDTTEGAGAVRVSRFNGSTWIDEPLLYAPDTSEFAAFGTAVAAEGNYLVVGAPYADPLFPTSYGAAYLFEFQNSHWQFLQKLVPDSPVQASLFGASVAIFGDAIVVGSPDDGPSQAGAAYVFRNVNGVWIENARLTSTTREEFATFGARVAIRGDTIAVSQLPQITSVYPSVQMFHRSADVWTHSCQVSSSQPSMEPSFGRSIALSDDSLFVGSPRIVTSPATAAVYVYSTSGPSCSLIQTIPDPRPETFLDAEGYGAAVAISSDMLLISDPSARQVYPSLPSSNASRVGVIDVYKNTGGTWVSDRTLIREFFAHDPFELPYVDDTQLGAAIAMNSFAIMGTSRTPFEDPSISGKSVGATLVFDRVPSDCDSNGLPDVCDSDLNHNLVVDACEIANGDVTDCNLNGIPDELDIPAQYVYDTGNAEFSLYVVGCDSDPMDVVWLNQFNVQPGASIITHVQHYWTGHTPHDATANILVYADPNNDGDPSDAVLLSSTVVNTIDAIGFPTNALFTTYPIVPTNVGSPGDSFFVAIKMSVECEQPLIPAGVNPDKSIHSWLLIADPATFNPNDLSNVFSADGYRFLIRAISLDCNSNSIPDFCDISANLAIDANANNIIDECEMTLCAADISSPHDSLVNIDDLTVVILAWGTANEPADITNDGIVNIDDLTAIILAWGSCP